MDLGPSLPDDVLAGVLRRLAPRGLAASRCVCKAWRHVVDDHCLLRADLLPLSLGGIFLNLHDLRFTQFLSRPTTGAVVSGRLDYTVPGEHGFMPPVYVRDHCNGLLLLDHCVVNPATQQWAPLPPLPPLPDPLHTEQYLLFDPTLSLNYDLLIVPDIPSELNDECEESEWPPSTLILHVFSSEAGSWEERTFGREGEAAGMLADMVGSRRHFFDRQCGFFVRQCGYWRGELYICCENCFVMRISLSNNTYQAIRMPTEDVFYLGKSINGIYCASIFQGSQLQVWFLNDQCVHGQTEWVLKHGRDIFPFLPNLNYDEQCDGPWILQDFYYCRQEEHNSYGEAYDVVYKNEAILEEKFVWDSDNDNVLEPGSRCKDSYIYFLGFHPYKEVVFLSDKFDRVLAYNWSSSRVQDLGKVFPKFYIDWNLHFHHTLVAASFPYTPCWLGELPEKLNLEAQLED
ncbi:hypothetical protein BDA96_03G307600 [Sorghum bicolor]|uniref:F-box domain-containing protein n=1 Tax=Sorghum bicolor TaxID=4558 RepID=A0A921URM8_SORBI|nr:hypothetical protein BDA96_03G307600 [Sorghum bicolor]